VEIGVGGVRALLKFDPEIRSVTYTTNGGESIQARFRRSVARVARHLFETAALKYIYLTVRGPDPTGPGRQRWINRWMQALNAFAITFGNRILSAPK
jgi:transposase-like protein